MAVSMSKEKDGWVRERGVGSRRRRKEELEIESKEEVGDGKARTKD